MLSKNNLVTSKWLNENIQHPNLIVLYTQMADPVTGQTNGNPVGYIPNSIFFDFENVFCDTNSNLPHTMPNQTNFTQGAQKLGINHDSVIVVYDNKGIYCAPRVWWMFKSMGHNNVYVLNGGLEYWLAHKLPTQPQLEPHSHKYGDFQSKYNSNAFISIDKIVERLPNLTVLDARSAGRFNGSEAEPRQGLRSGHIPTSINLPFTLCLEGTLLKSTVELKIIFSKHILNSNELLVFSCGSGVTACILALAASEAGYTNLAVYDGSWSEWGARKDLNAEL